MNATNRFQVKGVNDDRDFCECCGKQGLKKVVWIEDTETGEIKHFGEICALKPAKGFGDIKSEIKSATATWKAKVSTAWSVARRLYREAGGTFEPIYEVQKDGRNLCIGSRPSDLAKMTTFFKVAA